MKTTENLIIVACVIVLLAIGASLLKPATHAANSVKTGHSQLVNSLRSK